VHGVAALRVQVVVEDLFEVDQAALARSVGPVLQGRQRQRVFIVHGAGSARRRTLRPDTTTRCPVTHPACGSRSRMALAGQSGAKGPCVR